MFDEKSIYKNATGPVPIRMTNDYLFKALLQKNQRVLKELICSLLFVSTDKVINVHIENPIILGEKMDEKSVFLDVNVSFNNGELINLEMQVVNEENWPERSTYYACRNYSSLNKGDDYDEVMPVYQIGILDFTPFDEHPKFYSRYMLSEVDNHYIYNDKFTVGTLDLTNIHLATDTDKAYNIDKWARLFKAQTWEDIKMLAKQYEAIDDAATTIYQISEDDRIRYECWAREDYEKRQRALNRKLEQKDEIIRQDKEIIQQSKETINDMAKRIAELEAKLAEKE